MSNRDTELALGATPGDEPPGRARRASAKRRTPRPRWPLPRRGHVTAPAAPPARPGLVPDGARARRAAGTVGNQSRLLTACTAVVVLIDPNCALGYWSFQARNARRRRGAAPARVRRR